MTIGTGSAKAGPRRTAGTAQEDRDYGALEERVRSAVRSSAGPLFTTTAGKGLFEAFLGALPAGRRHHYDCRACRKFVDRYGGLVTIDPNGDPNGRTRSAFWEDGDGPGFFASAVATVDKVVRRARVTGVFLTQEPTWGLPQNRCAKAKNGTWHHLHALPNARLVSRPGVLQTIDAMMAEKREEFGMLSRGLEDFPIEVVRVAYSLLTGEKLSRSEKCVGVARWLLDLHEARAAARSKNLKDNVAWLAVASAPPGYCHVRTTMIGTLLEDLAAGKDYGEVARAFNAKVRPDAYQRPKAAPTVGQLAAAERIVEKLGSEGSLDRRYAYLDELRLRAEWLPPRRGFLDRSFQQATSMPVFGHLAPPSRTRFPGWGFPGSAAPATAMTWEKFSRTVLPEAERIEYLVPTMPSSFFAFVTAVRPNSPPILQWDGEEDRNPVSWYVYNQGSMAMNWALSPGSWVEVDGVFRQPSSWTGTFEHQGDGAYFVLNGVRDLRGKSAGIGLFPEILKSEYHGIRAALEAYSRSRQLGETYHPPACGIALQKSRGWNETFRVTSRGASSLYRLDRWD